MLITASFSALLAIWLWHKDFTRPRTISITHVEPVSAQGCANARNGFFVRMGCAMRDTGGAKFD